VLRRGEAAGMSGRTAGTGCAGRERCDVSPGPRRRP
jgi:hypothetical protein